jgi:catechol 2,3-dioxygenase-like lactoylglutathione lyase family enzyme
MAFDKVSKPMTRREAVRLIGCSAVAAATLPHAIALAPAPVEEKSFSALAYRRLSYDVHDFTRTCDFYSKLFGMKVAFEDSDRCVLEFGDPINALYLRNLKKPGDKAHPINFAFSLVNYDSQQVADELTRRNLSPRADGKFAWAIHDPNGFTIHLCSEREEFSDMPLPPQPAGAEKSPFKAIAVSRAVIRTDDIAKTGDFYMSLLGMRKIFEDDHQCFLAFGPADNHLYLRKLDSTDTKPFIESFAFTIGNFNRADVAAELDRQGLAPEPDSAFGFTTTDPDGTKFGIAKPGLPEYFANACHGDSARCVASK